MDPLFAYILGIITAIIIFLPFWVLSGFSPTVASAYSEVFCDQLAVGNTPS